MLIWVFGDVIESRVTEHSRENASGTLVLEKAEVNWSMSIDAGKLPAAAKKEGLRTSRSLSVDGSIVEFSNGFTELHTRAYEEILAGKGVTLQEAKKAIGLVHAIRNHHA